MGSAILHIPIKNLSPFSFLTNTLMALVSIYLKIICKSNSRVDKYMMQKIKNLPFPEKLKDAFNITVKVPENKDK